QLIENTNAVPVLIAKNNGFSKRRTELPETRLCSELNRAARRASRVWFPASTAQQDATSFPSLFAILARPAPNFFATPRILAIVAWFGKGVESSQGGASSAMAADRKPEFFAGKGLKIGIIGCGYVGLPLALRFADV